jgi:hypothetical protein
MRLSQFLVQTAIGPDVPSPIILGAGIAHQLDRVAYMPDIPAESLLQLLTTFRPDQIVGRVSFRQGLRSFRARPQKTG